MKRTIWIFLVLLVALVLWDRGSQRNRTIEEGVSEPSESNVSTRIPRPSRAVQAFALMNDGEETIQISRYHSPGLSDDWERLNSTQVEAYLNQTKRSAESLLNAFIETGDTNYLSEAAQKHPENRLVQWTMVFEGSPDQRLRWLEALKTSSPDNALPHYISALDKLKEGNMADVITEFDIASRKNADGFELERAASREEMYLLVGCSPLEAKEKSFQTIGIEHLPEMKRLTAEIMQWREKYRIAGDIAADQDLAKLNLEIAQKFLKENRDPFINRLVGYAMQYDILRPLDPDTFYDFLGKTAGERLAEVQAQQREERDTARQFPQMYPQLSDAEKSIYWNRVQVYGELNALMWLKSRSGQ